MPDSDRMEAPPARSQLRDRAARRLRWIVLWLGCAAPACGSGPAPGVASPLASRSDAGAPGPVSVRSLQPTEAPVGSNALTLTLTGENFGGRTRLEVTWSATGTTTELQTTVEDPTRLTALLPVRRSLPCLPARATGRGFRDGLHEAERAAAPASEASTGRIDGFRGRRRSRARIGSRP